MSPAIPKAPNPMPTSGASTAGKMSIVCIVLDDVGIDKIGCYGLGANLALTPNIDAVAAAGVKFKRAWAMPVCSPTRGLALTGKLPGRLGGGTAILSPGENGGYAQALSKWYLPTSEITLPKRLKDSSFASSGTYTCGHFGKFHLGQPNPDSTGYDFPRTMYGFDYSVGWPYNFNYRASGVNSTETANGYLRSTATATLTATTAGQPRILNGTINNAGNPAPGSLTNAGGSPTDFHAGWDSARIADDFIAWESSLGANEPYFAWIAFHGYHVPVVWPPYAEHSQTCNYPAGHPEAGLPIREGDIFGDITTTYGLTTPIKPWAYANIQSLDYQIGRIIDAIDLDNTMVIILADNGSAATLGSDGYDVESPFDPMRAKGSMYEAGVQVPLVMQAPFIAQPGRTIDGITSIGDIYQTVMEVATGRWDSKTCDSISLMSCLVNSGVAPRCTMLAQFFTPNTYPADFVSTPRTTDWYGAINSASYKLIRRVVGSSANEMYHLASDPWESTNLLLSPLSAPAQSAKAQLEAYINGFRVNVEGLTALAPL